LHRSRSFYNGIYARAGKQTGIPDLDPVVPGKRSEDVGILGQLVLGERRERPHALFSGLDTPARRGT